MLKRKRDPTFTFSEKEILLDLVTTHYLNIESKKTDAVSMKQKTKEWLKIATEFNVISGTYPRKWVVLRNCWENLKKKAKHELTLRNQHFIETGEEPPKTPFEDPFINRVLDLIQARVSPIMLKEKKNPALIELPSPDVQQQPDSQECHAPCTPPKAKTSSAAAFAATTTSGRRPAYKERPILLKAYANAEEEHEIKMKILRLQEEKEKEMLKQEILKTKQEEMKLQILSCNN